MPDIERAGQSVEPVANAVLGIRLAIRSRMTKTRSALTTPLMIIALSSGLGCSSRADSFDPRADDVVRRMSAYIASMHGFRFVAEHTREAILDDGQKIHMSALTEVQALRPYYFHTRRLGEPSDATLFYDGRKITVYSAKNNYYSIVPAPETLEEAVRFAGEKLGMETPAAELLSSSPYQALTKDALGSRYLGLAQIDGIACDHVAYRAEDVDFQLWIQNGEVPLPRRYVITSKERDEKPDLTVAIWTWEKNNAASEEDFTFAPPIDAQELDLSRRR